MNPLDEIAAKIIKEQELVIGPLAWSEAAKVAGLRVVNRNTSEVSVFGSDQKVVIDRLVAQYERLFGRASEEVCRRAAAALVAKLSPSDVPSSLVA